MFPDDTIFMLRCFDLARLGLGNVKQNPLVGSVITHKGRIIGEGYHAVYGQAHAEVNAIHSVKERDRVYLREATIYVSLEPCFHFGKTPPCVDLILQEGIPRVVIACVDPNPKVAGKSIEKLRCAGVEVVTGVLAQYGKSLIRAFIKNMEQSKPYVILKWSQSNDGFIGNPDRRVLISNSYIQRLVHKWRFESDAILVGTNTVLIDNPRLDTRAYFGQAPIRIAFDRWGTIPRNYHILDDNIQTIIFNDHGEALEGDWTRTRFLPLGGSLDSMLSELYSLGIGTLFVEGGAGVLGSFIESGDWDEARVIEGLGLLGSGVTAPLLRDAELIESYSIEGDLVSIYSRIKLPNITKEH